MVCLAQGQPADPEGDSNAQRGQPAHDARGSRLRGRTVAYRNSSEQYEQDDANKRTHCLRCRGNQFPARGQDHGFFRLILPPICITHGLRESYRRPARFSVRFAEFG